MLLALISVVLYPTAGGGARFSHAAGILKGAVTPGCPESDSEEAV